MATRNVTYHVIQPRPGAEGEVDEFYVTFDRKTEADAIAEREQLGYIEKFDVNLTERETIKDAGELEVVDGELVIREKGVDPLAPIIEAERARQQQQADEYQAWLQTPEGRVAQRYMYYQTHGFFPEDAPADYNLEGEQ